MVNKLQGILNICARQVLPGFGDRRGKSMLGDMAILTGGTVISDDLGLNLENLQLTQLVQRPSRSRSTRTASTIIQGGTAERLGHRQAD